MFFASYVLDFPYLVYVDYSGSFAETNMCIPEDNRFHSFLLNKEGHPCSWGILSRATG